MANEVAGITLRADSRDIRTAEKDLDRMADAAKRGEKAGLTMARGLRSAFAALGVGLVIRSIIRNTIEEEQAVAQLNATLKSTGRFTPELSKAMLDYASSLQQVTTFADEAIVSAQSQLLTFTKLGSEVFPRATEAVLNLATKMKGDLQGAVVQIGKALQDPIQGITALTRSGIQFSDSQKAMIKELVKSGDLLGAQKIILGELETQFGDSARAARDTFGGALAGLSNTISDLMEGKGGGLRGATDAVNDLTRTLNDPDVQKGFAAITTGLFKLIDLTARGAAGVANFGENLANLFGGMDQFDLDDRVEEIADLQKQLVEAREKSINIFGRENTLFAAHAKSLENEIKLKKELLQADLDAGNLAKQKPAAPPDFSGLNAPQVFDEIIIDPETKNKVRELTDLISERFKAGKAAANELQDSLNALAGEIGGPSIQAANELANTLALLDAQERTLQQTGQLGITQQQQLASARALATQSYNDRIEAIRKEEAELAAQLTPAEQVIENLQFELDLLKLTNDEREIAIALRNAEVDATSAQGQAISDLVRKLQAEQEAIAQMDALRNTATDSLADFIGGFSSAGDAVDQFFERLRRAAAQAVAEKLIESLLGSFGTSGSGKSGGFGQLLGSIFGGGRAHGGPVVPGRMYEVSENGPEILRSGSRQFLIPGPQGGNVTPISNVTNNSRRTNVNVTIMRPVTRETSAQIAQDIARTQRRAEVRNR